MSVYEIANKLIAERASSDEFHMELFSIMVAYFSGNVSAVYADFVEFRRLTNIDYRTYNECMEAAKVEAHLTFA